jgi:hypothetical protein
MEDGKGGRLVAVILEWRLQGVLTTTGGLNALGPDITRYRLVVKAGDVKDESNCWSLLQISGWPVCRRRSLCCSPIWLVTNIQAPHDDLSKEMS